MGLCNGASRLLCRLSYNVVINLADIQCWNQPCILTADLTVMDCEKQVRQLYAPDGYLTVRIKDSMGNHFLGEGPSVPWGSKVCSESTQRC